MSEAATGTELEAATPTKLVIPEAAEVPEVVFDPIALVRELIVHEVTSSHPSFELIKKYTDVLKATMAHKGQLSVEDVSEPARPISQGHFITGTNDLVTAGTITMGGAATQPLGHRRSDLARDDHIGTLEDIARRAGPDPLATILDSWESVRDLYPEDERETLRARVRQAVEERLPALSTALIPATEVTPT